MWVMKTKNSKKDKYYFEFDLLKGLAIIFVIIGHSLSSYSPGIENSISSFVFYLMYSFHMPLFFMISGFLFTKNISNSFKQKWNVVKNKFVRLFIPYLTYSVITMILKVMFSQYAMNDFALTDFYKIFISDNPNGGLWFLYVLFFVSIISALVLDEKKIKTYILFVLSFGLIFLSNYMPESIYFIARILRYLPYFLFGIIINYHYDYFKKIINKNFIIGIITFIVNCLLINKMDFETFNIYMVILAFCGIIWSYILINFINKESILAKFLNELSKYAISIYLLSYFVSVPFKILAAKLLFPYYLTIVLNIILSCTIPIFVTKYIIKNNKVLNLLLLGKK